MYLCKIKTSVTKANVHQYKLMTILCIVQCMFTFKQFPMNFYHFFIQTYSNMLGAIQECQELKKLN